MRESYQHLDDLIDVLELEAQAIADMDLTELITLSERKLQLLEQVQSLFVEPPADEMRRDIAEKLAHVRQLAQETERKFKAVTVGMNSALERIGRLTNNVSIGAYSPSGKPLSFDRANGTYKISL